MVGVVIAPIGLIGKTTLKTMDGSGKIPREAMDISIVINLYGKKI
ncbi:hypothetical protein EV07_1763 [Prochlorococcus sp. MIT 0603]|nr:hypothetical protein EV07_1763 [Prochlorococcus sp. MIT 0603]